MPSSLHTKRLLFGFDLCEFENSTVCRLFNVEGFITHEEKSQCRYFEKYDLTAVKHENEFGNEVTTPDAVDVVGIGGTQSSGCADCNCISGSYISSDLYQITLGGQQLTVECIFKIDGSAHTVIYNRHNGSANFNRTYAEYENGFGSASSERWIGNKYIHLLTQAGNTVMRIEVKFQGFLLNTYAVEYSHFTVGNASTAYKLAVSGYSGSIGDIFSGSNGAPFSTRDLDNDPNLCGCANRLSGGWWFLCCSDSRLTLPCNGYNRSLSFGWPFAIPSGILSTSTVTADLFSAKMMLSRI